MKKLISDISAVELPVRATFALIGCSVFVGASVVVQCGGMDVRTYLATSISGLVALGAALVSWTKNGED